MDAPRLEKSTTGRIPRAPLWLRSGLKVTHLVAPPLAARLARQLYFRPARLRARREEQAVLERGTPFTLTAGGASVAARSWGSGPVAWLVHGWSGQLGQLTPFVDPLLGRGFRVVGFDWPGHGASSGTSSSLVAAWQTFEQLRRVVGGPEVVVAHSFGAAAVTLGLARGLAPRRVAYLSPLARLRPLLAEFSSALDMSEAQAHRFVEGSEQWLESSFESFEPLAFAPALRVPLVIAHSRDDREVRVAEAEALAGAWPGARLHLLDGLGHRRLLRDPATVALVTEFLAGP